MRGNRLDFQSLTLENAGPFTDKVHIPLANQGLVLIEGVNQDENGSPNDVGKTLVWEILSWLLTGSSSRRRTITDLINKATGKNFLVEVRFKQRKHKYVVRRYKDHDELGTGFDLLKDGENIYVKRKLADTLYNITNLGPEDLFGTSYIAQAHQNILVHGTPSQKQNHIGYLYRLFVFKDMLQVTKDKLEVVEAQIADATPVEISLEHIEEQLAKYNIPKLKRLRKKLRLSIDHTRDGIKALRTKLTKDEVLLEQLRQRSKLEKIKRKLVDKLPKDVASLDDLRASVEELDTRLQKLTRLSVKVSAKKSLKMELEKLKARPLEMVKEELEKIRESKQNLIKEVLPQAKQRISLLKERAQLVVSAESVEDLNEQVDTFRDDIASLEKEISLLANTIRKGVCPTCGRPLEKDLSDQEYEDMQTRLKSSRDELSTKKVKYHRAKEKRQRAQRSAVIEQELEGLTDENPDAVKRQLTALNEAEKNLSLEEAVAHEVAVLKGQIKELPDGDTEELKHKSDGMRKKKKVEEEVIRLLERISVIQSTLDWLPSGEANTLSEDVASLTDQIESLDSKLNKLQDRRANIWAKWGTVKRLIFEQRMAKGKIQRLRSVKERAFILHALVKAFGSRGLELLRLRAIMKSLTKRLPNYTGTLFHDPNLRVTLEEDKEDKGVDLVMHRKHVSLPARLGSESVAKKLSLGLSFSIIDDMGPKTNILIADEPFSYLARDGREALLSILVKLKRHFSSIFVTSHEREILTSQVWDQRWRFVRQNEQTKLVMGDHHE